MELFNEYKNKGFRAIISIAERINNGEVFNKGELNSEYYKLSGDIFPSPFYNNVISINKSHIFEFDKQDNLKDVEFKVSLNENIISEKQIHIANIPLTSEKNWLHTALNDCLSKLFLSDEEIECLDSDLSEYPLYSEHIDDAWRKAENFTDTDAENFRIILKAINEKKSLSYPYEGKITESTPVKLEYDERQCKIFMCHYCGNRYIKTNISDFSDLKIKDTNSEDIPKIKDEMDKKIGYKPIVFIVTDNKNRNAIERAMLAFSVYDHIIEPIDEKTAKFTIQYYSGDLDILVKEILAFGADIKVESPKIAINKIIEKLNKF